ncbi:hypothetical protein QT972_27040 [Microcoleus sp. herbarium7]|uniref:hypothetical protein n=1 Tax=Microcoleus sp. herbarium7 TaxID=3055435 RepID=UPI002FD38FCE
MKRFQLKAILAVTAVVAIACRGISDIPEANKPVDGAAPTNASSTSEKTAPQASQKIAPPSPVATQVLSINAYKVPYLGFDGVFNLNAEHKNSVKDPRNPKRIDVEKMEKFSFYKDAAGKQPIARNCQYVYMGATPDSKYYAEDKMTWDLFELVKQEKQDPGCNRFQYLSFVPPQGESKGEPIHMHFRYGSKPSSFATLVNMTKDKEDAAKFSPWFATYCGGGKIKCGTGE